MSAKDLKTTPLHDWHLARGANMGQFAGYDMPLWYPSGARSEHLAVLTCAGVFDTSHMAVLTVAGPDARSLLQRCLTKDLDRCLKAGAALAGGRSVYGAFLDRRGHVIDDAIVFQKGEDAFLVVVNAGMGAAIAAHLEQHAAGGRVSIGDLSDRIGKMDLQGPRAARILGRILEDAQSVLADLVYFAFKGAWRGEQPVVRPVRLTNGIPLLLSRTGYTGEFGFEMFMSPEDLQPVWDMLLEAGQPDGLLACGLAARDSLRAGAVLPLSHQDIGSWPYRYHPWEFALPFDERRTGFSKSFVGDRALLEIESPRYTRPFAGLDLRKVTGGGHSSVVDSEGRTIGTVLTCVTDSGIDRVGERIFSVSSPDKPAGFRPRGLCCGFVRVSSPLAAGQTILLQDKRRSIRVMIGDDIRPDRTARRSVRAMLDAKEESA